MPERSLATGTRPPVTRAGYAALVGSTNVGKSTLLNALVGDKLSIVTPKAQTTWQRVTGIVTTDRTQVVLLDTPGLLDAAGLLQRAMLGAALEALAEADVVVVVLDASRPMRPSKQTELAAALGECRAPVIGAVNKIDVASARDVEELARWAHESLGATAYPISATEGRGLARLWNALEQALPVAAFLYPEDEIASQPVRFFVAELIRETVFEQYQDEIPYAVFVQIEEFREDQDPVYIGANVFVERRSQKGILVGDAGRAVKRLGRSARRKIEAFLGTRVYLDLWVKHLPEWRRRRSHLRRLGFKLPRDHELTARS